VFDAIALDYEKVTVLIDATAAARPEIHLCEYFHRSPILFTSKQYFHSLQFEMRMIRLMLDIFVYIKEGKLVF
jgi:hypothetical protein